MLLNKNDMDCLGTVMTNFDHSIDYEIAEKIKNSEGYGDYPGWDFHGTVWYRDGKFNCDIRVYGTYQQTISDERLDDLMCLVSDLYGWS